MLSLPPDFLVLGAGTASKWSITPAGVQRWPDGVWLRRWAGAALIATAVPDSYAPLSWWDRREETPAASGFSAKDRELCPYLAGAEDNFHRRYAPLDLLGPRRPLTWEAEASHAAYAGLRFAGIPPARRLAFPHTCTPPKRF